MADGLFMNTNVRGDFLRPALESANPDGEVFAAVAFYTYADIIKYWTNRGCRVRLIVRLCHATSPSALREVMDNKLVMVRYFTSRHFHPKLYILSGVGAFVGSSNLTDSGLFSNQEINLQIPLDDPRFVELGVMFDEYWHQAEVLTQPILEKFASIPDDVHRATTTYEAAMSAQIPEVGFANIQRPGQMQGRRGESLFESEFLKRYQAFLAGFGILLDIYRSHGRRKLSADTPLPLRVEVDRFLNWIREEKSRRSPKLTGAADTRLLALVEEYVDSAVDSYLTDLSTSIYPDMRLRLGSPEAILQLGANELFSALKYVYAFYDQNRWYGGFDNMQDQLFSRNTLDKVKNTLIYLLHGAEPFQQRVARCLLDPNLRLVGVGPSCLTELVGWVNREDVPLLNGRSRDSMRWLGFPVD